MTRASSILFWFALVIVASVMLYHTSYRVHDLSKQLHALNNSIDAERKTIRVLKAEWVYLSNPARIEKEARQHLSLKPAALQQIAKLNSLPEAMPDQQPVAVANTTINQAPKPAINAQVVSATKPKQKNLATADNDHINTHMIIQRSSNATAALPNNSSLILATFGTKP